MRKVATLISAIVAVLSTLTAQPLHEVRAAWLTTAYALDWPTTKATTPQTIQKQKKELCRILDALKATRFNTVLFQVRHRGGVIYPSQIEPYSNVLTGVAGRSPGYDPLEFAIYECHKRGLEIHAWLVTIPIGGKNYIAASAAKASTPLPSSAFKRYQGEWFLDPGHPQTGSYLCSIVNEITSQYDIDGIHLDYIRYPDHPSRFPDGDTYKRYGTGRSLYAWRRENITGIVRSIYKEVKRVKPWVKVSSSPVGKFKDTSRYSSRGWNAFHTVHQDAQSWLSEGIHDMLFPMMYFDGDQFYPFVLDWQEKSYGRQIVPGLGVYFMHPREKDWSKETILRQVNFIRSHQLAGQAYYRAQYLLDNTKRFRDELAAGHYAYPALTPPMPWLSSASPSSPQLPQLSEAGGRIHLSWKTPAEIPSGTTVYYNLYGSDTYPVDASCAANLLEARIEDTNVDLYTLGLHGERLYFALTAADRYGNESAPVQFTGEDSSVFIAHDGKFVYLPPNYKAAYITLTDICGSFIASYPYNVYSFPIDKLEKGFYRVFVTDCEGVVKHWGDLLK